MILLHGFPEFWYGWHKQIGALADAGFRVIAPDQRGYNLSSKPARVRDYRMGELTADVIAIADQIGAEKIHIAGHDWGAAVAWNTGMERPDRIRSLAILNVPHPAVMIRNLRTTPRQMLRSWYILYFQIPRVPELLMSLGNFDGVARGLRGSSRPGTFSDEDLARYREAWSQPGALRSMINWYRALARNMPDQRMLERARPISVPVRILWGARDAFLIREAASQSLKLCERGELFEFPDATHWIQHEEAARVNELLIEFFRRN